MGVETRAQLTAGDAKLKAVSEEDPVGSRLTKMEEMIEEQYQEIDRKFSEMLEAIRSNRFEKVLDDPVAELKQLKETNGIVEYHKKFELLSTRVNLTEDYLVRIYLDGLQIDTQVNVQMFQPQTIQQCFLIGRLYEHAHPRSNEVAKDTKVVEIEVNTEVETKSIEKRAHEAILKEDLIPQLQVPVSNLESSLRFHNASPVVCEDSHSVVVGCDELFNHQETILQASYTTKARDVLLKKSTSITNNQVAHQLFEKMPLREQSKKMHIKCSKCWRFKFKQRKQLRGKPRIAHELIYRAGVMYKYFGSSAKVALMKKKNKFSKTWSTLKDGCFKEDDKVYHISLPIWLLIRFKFWELTFINMNLQKNMGEHWLGIIESDAGHGQQALYKLIVMVNKRLLQTSLVIQQVIRNKKIKSSKRWWFKYKSVEEGMRRLHIELSYKCKLEFEEWFKLECSKSSELRTSKGSLLLLYSAHVDIKITVSVWHCWRTKFKLCLIGFIDLLQREALNHSHDQIVMKMNSRTFLSLTIKKHAYMCLFGSNNCVSTLGKRKLGKDWWFKYKTAAMAKDLLTMKLSQAWRLRIRPTEADEVVTSLAIQISSSLLLST